MRCVRERQKGGGAQRWGKDGRRRDEVGSKSETRSKLTSDGKLQYTKRW